MQVTTTVCDHDGNEIAQDARAINVSINVRATDGRSMFRSLDLHYEDLEAVDLKAIVTALGDLVPEPPAEELADAAAAAVTEDPAALDAAPADVVDPPLDPPLGG